MEYIQRYSALAILIVLLTSCDPGTDDLFIVDNKSEYEITVRYVNYQYDSIITVPSNQNQRIFIHFRMGQAGDRKDKFLNWCDTLSMTVNDSLKLNKDYLSRSEWALEIHPGPNFTTDGGESIYTFLIENKDID